MERIKQLRPIETFLVFSSSNHFSTPHRFEFDALPRYAIFATLFYFSIFLTSPLAQSKSSAKAFQ